MVLHARSTLVLALITLAAGCGGSEDGDTGPIGGSDAATEQSLSDTSPDDGTADVASGDGGPDAKPDAAQEAGPEGGPDASEDAALDAEEDAFSDAPADVVEEDAVSSDAGPTVTLSGIVNDFFGSPIGNANVAVVQSPGLSATTQSDGRFTLQLPAEEPMTLHATRAGFVDTYVQTAIPHLDTAMTLWMATPDNYDVMVDAGGGTAADAVFYISIRPGSLPCDLAGSQVTTSPPSGQVVYAEANGYPNGSYTSLPQGSTWAYIIGPTGTVVPELVSTTCTQLAYPVDVGFVTVLGPLEARPGAFHVMDMFLE